MSIQILMPALSPTMEEGTLAKWLVSEGDEVTAGDLIAEIETDKATMELEAVDEGTIGQIVVSEGTEAVAVNDVIAVLLEDGEDSAKVASLVASEVEIPAADKAPAERLPERVPEPHSEAKSEAKPSAPAPQVLEPEPDLPAGTTMVELTVREALRDAMAEEMRLDGDVFLIGEEVAEYQGAYKVSQGLLDEFGPKRVIDTPITEHGFAGLAIGAAMAGLKPIVEFMTFNFAMQAIDHIVNSAAKTRYMSDGQVKAPIVFRGPNGPASRVGAQHSQCYAAWYAQIPGLRVIAPYSAADAKGLLKAAIRDPNPVVFLEHELLYGQKFDVPETDYVLPIGKARTVREGTDVSLITFAFTVGTALQAAEILAEQGISAEVIDLRTLRPLDKQAIIDTVKKTNRAVVIEQGWATCGVTAELSALIMEEAFDWLDAPVMRIAGADVPMPYAANLEQLAIVQPDDIVQAARAVCYRDGE
jgi:pyruvate dehydrogenase E1 component beta subunit